MYSVISNIVECRICKSNELKNVISLGEQMITSRFPLYGDNSTPKTPIDLCMCQQCGLLQLLQTTFSNELYEYEYGYRSGISNTMREHLHKYHEEILSKVSLIPGDTIVDIGSNDSTMLQYYSSVYNRIGIDPTGRQFADFYGDVKLLPTYFNYDNFKNAFGDLRCKIVSSISMFYDLPDPVQFAKDIYNILDDDGLWTCEQSYLLTMLKTNSIDTICHEHLEYYALKQIKEIADRANFKMVDILFNDCNGGSFRIYFAKKDSLKYQENTELIHQVLNNEEIYGLTHPDCFINFMKKTDYEIKKLCDFIDTINENGKNVYIYGASTKGNCLLQYAKLDETKLKYAVERNLNKVGKMTCTGIEIISEETMRKNPPDYLLVLPWHFRNEIVEREKEYLNNGGKLIFPFPTFEIVSSNPKLLLTGCDGHIAHFIKESFAEYSLFGIGHTNPMYQNDITKFYFNMNDKNKLEHIVKMVNPDIIVHLAGISSSQFAYSNSLDTLQVNGMITAYLCDIIHSNNLQTKLFNASSSEIYKGHVNYLVNENDNNMYHNHPYSIAKIMAHTTVDFYRNTYNLPFSNGVIFTTESNIKKPIFLLNKVAKHIKTWNTSEIREPLVLGPLESYRNILHVKDVVAAIKCIIRQPIGDTYLICNTYSTQINDLVIKLYLNNRILLNKRENIFYDSITNLPIIIINDSLGNDVLNTNIQGYPHKLLELGWTPNVSIDDILDELSK